VSDPRYSIGIDLGTTHTALAYSTFDTEPSALKVFDVPQLVTRGAVEARALLPSFLYFSHESEGKLSLPWGTSETAVGD